MSMNPKWFKQVDGKPSRFAQLYYDYIGNVCDSVSHAFSTLLAEDAAADDAPTDTLWQYDVDARIATLERMVKRLRKRGKGYHVDIVSLDQRLTPLEEFLDGVPAFGAAFEGLKQVAPDTTPAQRAALRLMVGITPETHPIYFPLRPCKVCERSIVSAQGFSGGLCSCGQFRLAEGKSNCLPCPLTGGDEADDVWLAPVMRWVGKHHDAFIEQHISNITTEWLLDWCLENKVPEVVAIFDMEKDNDNA